MIVASSLWSFMYCFLSISPQLGWFVCFGSNAGLWLQGATVLGLALRNVSHPASIPAGEVIISTLSDSIHTLKANDDQWTLQLGFESNITIELRSVLHASMRAILIH